MVIGGIIKFYDDGEISRQLASDLIRICIEIWMYCGNEHREIVDKLKASIVAGFSKQ